MLEKLKRLHEAATPEPWRSAWEDEAGTAEAENDDIVIYAPDAPTEDRLVVGITYYDRNWAACSEPNAALIAAARNALPALFAVVEAARDALVMIESVEAEHRYTSAEGQDLRAALAALEPSN